MKKEDILPGDWQRILFGEVPGGFYLEAVFRIGIIYLVLMVSMRLMGKRMASQLSRNEMIAMVSLAAAIGVPLMAPDRGILPAVIIALVVVAIQQLTARLASSNQVLESVTQGDLTVLIADGRMRLDNMKKTGITRRRTFAQLRSEGIIHLGEVKRLYFEAGGTFTLIREDHKTPPGLGILPENDRKFAAQVYRTTDHSVCRNCGQPEHSRHTAGCSNCGGNDWVPAVSREGRRP